MGGAALWCVCVFFVSSTQRARADGAGDCFQSKDVAASIRGCTAFLQIAQGDAKVKAHAQRGLAYAKNQQFYEAIEDFNVWVRADPDQAEAYFLRGLAYEGESRDDSSLAKVALEDLDRSVRLNPDLPDSRRAAFAGAYVVRGLGFVASRQDGRALVDMKEATRLQPKQADEISASFGEAYWKRSRGDLVKGDYGQTARDIEQAIGFNPRLGAEWAPYLDEARKSFPGPHMKLLRGLYHAESHQIELAKADFTEAINLKGDFVDAYLERAALYFRIHDVRGAFRDVDEAIKLAPQKWNGFAERAQFYRSLDRFDEAHSDYDRAIELMTTDPQARNNKEVQTGLKDEREFLLFSTNMEAHWVQYLKEIQSEGAYPNWPDKPFDLYLRTHSAGPRVFRFDWLVIGTAAVGTASAIVVFLALVRRRRQERERIEFLW